MPNIGDAGARQWLKALSMEPWLVGWVVCSDFNLLHDHFIEARKPCPENSFHLRLLVAVHRGLVLLRGGSGAGEYVQSPFVQLLNDHGAKGRAACDLSAGVRQCVMNASERPWAPYLCRCVRLENMLRTGERRREGGEGREPVLFSMAGLRRAHTYSVCTHTSLLSRLPRSTSVPLMETTTKGK